MFLPKGSAPGPGFAPAEIPVSQPSVKESRFINEGAAKTARPRPRPVPVTIAARPREYAFMIQALVFAAVALYALVGALAA